MAFLDKTGLQTLTSRLVQGDAVKAASHRGHSIENVINNITRECTNVPTPLEYEVENRITNFKIGQGRDINVQGDIDKGIIPIKLQGRTWHNFINDKNWLHEKTSIASTHTNNVGLLAVAWSESDKNPIKAGCTYTFMCNFDIYENTLANIYGQLNYCPNTGEQASMFTIGKSTFEKGGLMRVKVVIPSNYSRLGQFFIGGYGGTLSIKSNGLLLLEGDHTQTPIEELPFFFTELKSSFEDGNVTIKAEGKNLFRYEDVVKRNSNSIVEIGDDYVSITDDYYCGSMVKVDKNTRYYVSAIRQPVGSSNGGNIAIFQSDGTGVQGSVSIKSIGVENGYFDSGENEYVSVLLYGGSAKRGTCIFRKVQIEKGGRATEYERYYSKEFSFDIGEPLRSLPNGICDEIKDGNLIRRVGKKVLNGSEPWDGVDNKPWFLFNDMKRSWDYTGRMYCDTLPVAVNYGTNDPQVSVSGYANSTAYPNENWMYILNNGSATNVKNWLKTHPTTVYYELSKPTVVPIDRILFEAKSRGVVSMVSDVSPTSFHTVQLNRAGQIERGIVEISKLKNRVEKLETMYDSHFLETAHKLELLGMDYELESEEF